MPPPTYSARLAELEQTVAALEERIVTLEGRLSPMTVTNVGAAPYLWASPKVAPRPGRIGAPRESEEE